MKTRNFLFAAAALTVLTACSSDDQTAEPMEQRTPVTLEYTTLNATETRAAQNLNEGTFATGETVKVRISNTGANSWTDYDFTTAAEGAMNAPDPEPFYPAGAQNIDIVAYYPATVGTSFTVQADQTSDANYKASDLMFASVTNQAKQTEAVNLAFTHKMAKICVNVTAGTGLTSITSVSIVNVKPTVTFDQATGTVGEASGDATTIAMTNEGAAVIPAQTIDGELLSIETDNGTATYTVSNKAFESGKQYTLNITVNLRNVGTTNVITGWTSEGTVTVYAERPNINGHEYVDMGDGLKWATYNMGAYNPWEYGDYYAWGVTTTQTDYYWDTYPFIQSGYTTNTAADYITKYNSSDGKTSFADYSYADDAARQRWGSTWRIPTYEEWTTLRGSNYSWVWTTNYLGSGINGMLVTRKANTGPCSGNSIFLPAAGYRVFTNIRDTGSNGWYWSSSLYSSVTNAESVYFNNSTKYDNEYPRYMGMSIRPVSE